MSKQQALKVEIFSVPKTENNSYVISIENECIIIDPSFSCHDIEKYIDQNQFKVLAILLTHGHFDHIGHASLLAKKYRIKIYVHIKERDILSKYNFAEAFGYDFTYNDDAVSYFECLDHLKFNQFEFEVIDTPGHTPGGVCYLIGEHFFTGDTLFYHSVGRCDLPLSSLREMNKSLKLLSTMNDDLIVYPGHAKIGLLKEIKQHNPYLKQLIK